jgi:hypothetical protein
MFDLISFVFPMVIGAAILALGYFLGRIDWEPRKDAPTPGPKPEKKAKDDEPKPKPYDSW